MCFHDIMQKKLDILNSIRAEEEKVNGDYAMWQIELMDQKLMAQVTRAAIDSMGELKECLSYEDGKLVADKRILFLLSYQMFQRQYFYSTRELKKELEQRMGLPVDIIENNTKNVRPGKMSIDEIWFGLTDEIRKSVACDDAYFDSLMYEHYSVYVRTPDGNEMVGKIREQGTITSLADDLYRAGVSKGICLRILKNSSKKANKDSENLIKEKKGYEVSIEKLKKEKSDTISSFVDIFNSKGLSWFSRKIIRDVLTELAETDSLDKGIPDITAKTIDYLKKRGVCICGTCLKENSKELEAFNELLKFIPPKSLGNFISDFSGSAKQRLSDSENFYEDSVVQKYRKIREKDSELEELNSEISGTLYSKVIAVFSTQGA